MTTTFINNSEQRKVSKFWLNEAIRFGAKVKKENQRKSDRVYMYQSFNDLYLEFKTETDLNNCIYMLDRDCKGWNSSKIHILKGFESIDGLHSEPEEL